MTRCVAGVATPRSCGGGRAIFQSRWRSPWHPWQQTISHLLFLLQTILGTKSTVYPHAACHVDPRLTQAVLVFVLWLQSGAQRPFITSWEDGAHQPLFGHNGIWWWCCVVFHPPVRVFDWMWRAYWYQLAVDPCWIGVAARLSFALKYFLCVNFWSINDWEEDFDVIMRVYETHLWIRSVVQFRLALLNSPIMNTRFPQYYPLLFNYYH